MNDPSVWLKRGYLLAFISSNQSNSWKQEVSEIFWKHAAVLLHLIFPLNLALEGDYKTNGWFGLPDLFLPPPSHTSPPPSGPFASVFISVSLLHAFVPELTLARPRFDLLISPYKQVRTHSMGAGHIGAHTNRYTQTHKRLLHKAEISPGCVVIWANLSLN